MKHTIEHYTESDLRAALQSPHYSPVKKLAVAVRLAEVMAQKQINHVSQKYDDKGAFPNGW